MLAALLVQQVEDTREAVRCPPVDSQDGSEGEESHMLHVSHDILEHLQAPVQQGKPAQAIITVIKAVTR